MKRLILYIGILGSLLSCRHDEFQPMAGDLLFQINASSEMTDAITASTGRHSDSYSHVAIATGADSVIEATSRAGVRMTSLADFRSGAAKIARGQGVVVMRLKDTTGIGAAVAHARTHLGEPYDYSYLPNNGKMYCSELVYESYRTTEGRPLFTARPMNFRDADGALPPFWIELFAGLNESVPEGLPGTNPSEMAQEAILREVHRYF